MVNIHQNFRPTQNRNITNAFHFLTFNIDSSLEFSTIGYIGTLKLNIPWKHLFPTPSKPVVVEIRDVFIVLGPNLNQPYNEQAVSKRARSAKDSAVVTWEEDWRQAHLSDEEKKVNASFKEKLVASIINNLQISIHTLHIRYEDDVSYPDHPFVAGVTIHSIQARTTDEQFRPAFTGGMPTIVYKLASLEYMSIYFNTVSRIYFHETENGW